VGFACLPEGSIFVSCSYCITRLIEPLDDESWDIYIQEDDESGVFVHASCMVLDIDLHDHVVRGCNKFDDGEEFNPFFNNKFLNG
jgi:hypothetical protein